MSLKINYDNVDLSLYPSSHPEPHTDQYQILLEYDLRREKEKNHILEQRLKNKEIFIEQMKHFQEELTIAYEQCKNELVQCQHKVQYLQNVEYRDYQEQIEDLKHMLMKKGEQPSKRTSISREEARFPSSRDRSQKSLTATRVDRRKHSLEGKLKQKFFSNVETFRGGSQVSNVLFNQISTNLNNLKKSVKFIQHFLHMSDIYIGKEGDSQQKVTKKLKKSWKWIKQVVKEWDFLRGNNVKHESFRRRLEQWFNLDHEIDLQIMLEYIKNSTNQFSMSDSK